MAKSTAKASPEPADDVPARRRILDAAFSAFMESGFADASTLEIATRARVSKRELYALVGSKQEMLAACIAERAGRLQLPVELPAPTDREALARTLVMFGTQLLREVSDPAVIAVFRLAIAEAVRAPEVARTLNTMGVETSRAAVRSIMSGAQAAGLLGGDATGMADQFIGLLWGNLMTKLLLGVSEPPNAREIAKRARAAVMAFLQLHPHPDLGYASSSR